MKDSRKFSSNPETTSGSQPVLGLLRLPARVNAEEAAALLGMEPWDVPLLVKARLLKPLGRETAKNRVKYFSSVVIEKSGQDPKWLDAATTAISRCRTDERPKKRATATSNTQPNVTASSTSSRATPSGADQESGPTQTGTLKLQQGAQ